MIHADSESRQFCTRFTNGEHVGSADTTADKGGGGMGFRPHELLEAAVATCMNMSLRMCAEKHGIPLTGATVVVSLKRNAPETPALVYRIQLYGALSDEQQKRLLASVDTCPVRTTLSNSLRFALETD